MNFKLNALASGAALALAAFATPALAVDVAVYNLDSTAVGAFGAPTRRAS